jgi:hypothetical protein
MWLICFLLIYLLTAIGFHLVAVQIYTQTVRRTTQITTNVEECGTCPVFASFTLAFALQLRKKYGKTSVRVRKPSVRLRKTSVKVQYTFLISKFCRVLYVVCFLLGNSPASEFYMPTFWNTLSVPSS